MEIIIIDDEIVALQYFLKEIVNLDHDINYKFFSNDTTKIFSYLKTHNVEVAFLDINMPNINGFEIAERINLFYPNIQFIFITGLDIDISSLPPKIRNNTIGILNKPYSTNSLNKIFNKLKNIAPVMEVKALGTFDVFIKGKPIIFSSSKSKELFALLIMLNGKTLSMELALSYLWPNKEVDKAKILYRDSVWRLRAVLKDYEFECVDFQRALIILNKTNIKCDYWDYLNGSEIPGIEQGFCNNYSWADKFNNQK